MGEAGTKHIAFVIDEDLCLVLEPAEGGGVDDTIAITLENPAHARVGLFMKSSTTAVVGRSVGFQLVHRVLPRGKCSAVRRGKHPNVDMASGG